MKEWEYLENVTPLPQRLWRLLCTDVGAVLRHPVKTWEETNYIPGTFGRLVLCFPPIKYIIHDGRRYVLEN